MIYPKDFSISKIEVKTDSIFVIMPFRDSFDGVYGIIRKVCLDSGIICNRADDIFDNKPIIGNILYGITTSEIVIADLTDKNPNVYYEVGIAHSLRDQDSIILMTQNINDVPFDIKHWPILIYDLQNLPLFKTQLREKLEYCRSISRRKSNISDFLRHRGIPVEDIHQLIEKAELLSSKKTEIVYRLLAGKFDNSTVSKSEIDGLLNYMVQLEEIEGGKFKQAIFQLKLSVFLSDAILKGYHHLAKDLLIRSRLDKIHLDDIDTFTFIAEFCFGLIERQKLKSEALDWIVQYLHNYRMGRIDVVRAKIEKFLLYSPDSDVNYTILKMLSSERTSVRESAADICGQKQIEGSISLLINTLNSETNPHVARSCISALTKLKAEDTAPVIYEWMRQNRDRWGDKAVSGALKNVGLHSLKELDKSGELYNALLNLRN